MSERAWWKLKDGNYVRPEACISVYAMPGAGTDYELEVDISGAGHRLAGTWSSQAAAQEAARELVHGIDVATFD